jgi:hypothetical protein
MQISDDVKHALIHEAGHAAAYHLLQHQNAGIAVLREGLKFCNIVAPSGPTHGEAGGSAAELLFFKDYDNDAARADKLGLGMTDAEYREQVNLTKAFLSPCKNHISKIYAELLSEVSWRNSLDDFPILAGPVGGMNLPPGGTFSMLMTADEIAAVMATT